MAQACPISERRVDTNLVRLISLQVAVCTVALLVTDEILWAYLLLSDFTLRVLRKNHLSPFYMTGSLVLKYLHILPKLSDEAPKRFALYMGLIVSLVILTAHLLGLNLIVTLLGTILYICALMEFIFDFCVGCKIYHMIQLFKTGLK